MDNVLVLFITLTLTFAVTLVTSTQSGADQTNAQATLVGVSGDSGSGGAHDPAATASRLVKRYIPRFVGKREPDEAEPIDTPPVTDVESQAGAEPDLNNFKTMDADNADEFLDILKEIEELSNVDKNAEYLSEHNDENLLEGEPDSLRLDNYFDEPEGDFTELGDIGDFNPEEFDSEGEDGEDSDMDKRGYRPRFIGKRYRPRFVGKRYIPRFVGKRYQPKFVGKRYIPRFVGKRYIPRFVGKRYQPRFVGKRYQPRFVGKRNYRPRFIGKRFPVNIQVRRYQPKFVGKRTIADIDIDDKRYQPKFVGKRYTPRFIGKRYYQPRFVGKRYYAPKFVGKREDETEIAVDDDDLPMVLEKRSAEKPDTVTITDENDSGEEPNSRRKRSIMDTSADDVLKRAWGRYVPWQEIPTYKILKVEGPVLDKRFVAPEFIGRRDSISSILSALNALRMARNEPRLASKRFNAPLFIGKRGGSDIQQTLFWNPDDQSQLLDASLESL